ncbi:MAG TPA: hypothetical protein VFL91_07095 [Thermomicrobiales bacterium]|jgi:hypothetical protein|nr:hypothetical protein [Thermomicrobiales bacterium]
MTSLIRRVAALLAASPPVSSAGRAVPGDPMWRWVDHHPEAVWSLVMVRR